MAEHTFKSVFTPYGKEVAIKAYNGGDRVQISYMGIGDGGGEEYTPEFGQEDLRNEWVEVPVNQVSASPDNPLWLTVEGIIPEDIGGHWIREVSVKDKNHNVIAVASTASTYKSLLNEGSTSVTIIRVVLAVNDAEAFELSVDTSIALVTRDEFRSRIAAEIAARESADNALRERITAVENLGDYAGSYATKANLPANASAFPNGIGQNDFATVRADETHSNLASRYVVADISDSGVITWSYDLTYSQDITGKVNKSGDIMTGALNFANGTENLVGNNVSIGDGNQAGTLVVKGKTADGEILIKNQSDSFDDDTGLKVKNTLNSVATKTSPIYDVLRIPPGVGDYYFCIGEYYDYGEGGLNLRLNCEIFGSDDINENERTYVYLSIRRSEVTNSELFSYGTVNGYGNIRVFVQKEADNCIRAYATKVNTNNFAVMINYNTGNFTHMPPKYNGSPIAALPAQGSTTGIMARYEAIKIRAVQAFGTRDQFMRGNGTLTNTSNDKKTLSLDCNIKFTVLSSSVSPMCSYIPQLNCFFLYFRLDFSFETLWGANDVLFNIESDITINKQLDALLHSYMIKERFPLTMITNNKFIEIRSDKAIEHNLKGHSVFFNGLVFT